MRLSPPPIRWANIKRTHNGHSWWGSEGPHTLTCSCEEYYIGLTFVNTCYGSAIFWWPPRVLTAYEVPSHSEFWRGHVTSVDPWGAGKRDAAEGCMCWQLGRPPEVLLLVTHPPCHEAPGKFRGTAPGGGPQATAPAEFPTEPPDDTNPSRDIPAPAEFPIRLPDDSRRLMSQADTAHATKNHPAHQRTVRCNQTLVLKATSGGSLLCSKRYSVN